MKDHHWGRKYHFFENAKNMKGIWFHLIGLAAIIWFCIRVLPAPHRSRYPCQQVSLVIALGYIAFWGALFTALRLWLPHARWRASKIAPSIVAIFVILIMISGVGFTVNFLGSQTVQSWDPIPKEPIGTPQGANPGRLVWVWNLEATEEELLGYWWNKENNNQEVIDQMYSDGIQQLSGVDDDYDAWDILFHYFNIEHGKGDVGYQPGEKISIKINMNNGYFNPYTSEYNDVDANPYVVKGLLRQLCDVVGVAEEDITVYDASRKLMNWFYNRVFYEEYPADPLIPEFPDVHFVDMDGGAEGREQVVASGERVYFAAGPCTYRTLPTVVTEADYMINMPITKRHVAERVTLAGKNWFGTWMEDVYPIHNYHTMGFSQMGNPAPQADLVAHERLGGNTLLLIGDGTYACRYGNSDINKFEMYPFNGDWMSSLFFSQDSVALDSVMFDFFMVEGTGGGPSEGAQNYLHQQAEPPEDLYDPENDGEYVSESMGVHEHWDTTENIFSSERYSGPSNNGIDYIAVSGGKLVANADGPYYRVVNEPVQFNGFATGGFLPYNWEWYFGDTHTSEEQNPTHTYTNPGNYNVTLTVTDNGSNKAIDTTYAWIQDGNTPPIQPSIEGPPSGRAGTSYPYTFKATDPEESIIWYYIDWDDGSNTGWIGPFNSGETITRSHKWDSQGTYIIKAKAKDPYNDESPWGMLEVTMPRNKAIITPFLNFLQSHPNMFPILQMLIQRLELQ